MNDDQIAQSINNLVSQGPDQGTQEPSANLGLGSNPSPQPSSPTNTMSSSLPDSIQPIDHGNSNPENNELATIKQQALAQLSPIVGKLAQTPEEKYRTIMMMVQASDDQTLIKPAYEAAKEIEDETKKAEALLNIVNEINYFSKNQSN